MLPLNDDLLPFQSLSVDETSVPAFIELDRKQQQGAGNLKAWRRPRQKYTKTKQGR